MEARVRYQFLSRMRRYERVAPKIRQDDRVRLGISSRSLFELSLSIALAFVIVLFRWFPDIEARPVLHQPKQELVTIEEIEQTRQETRPPPPARPPIPIETTTDEVLPDVDFTSTEINIAADVPPPPPPTHGDEQDEFADYFVVVEELPQLIGGLEGLMRRVQYPELALRAGIQGRVIVMAYVNEKGDVVKAEVQKGIGAGCDEAAVAAVMESKFIPGKQRGKAVRVRVVVPINFRIRGAS